MLQFGGLIQGIPLKEIRRYASEGPKFFSAFDMLSLSCF